MIRDPGGSIYGLMDSRLPRCDPGSRVIAAKRPSYKRAHVDSGMLITTMLSCLSTSSWVLKSISRLAQLVFVSSLADAP